MIRRIGLPLLLIMLLVWPGQQAMGANDPAIVGLCENLKAGIGRRIEQTGLAGDPIFSDPPVPVETEHWVVEWRGIELPFPAEEYGWHYAAFGKADSRVLQVGLEDRLTVRLGELDLTREIGGLDSSMQRHGLEPPADSAYEMLLQGLALAGDRMECATDRAVSLSALYGLRLKPILLRTPADKIYRRAQGIVVHSELGEQGQSWHLLAPNPESRQRLLSVQVLDRSEEQPHPVLLLLGQPVRSSLAAPSWAFHLFSYIETGGFEHLDWLEQRARDPQQRAAAASVRKVYGRR